MEKPSSRLPGRPRVAAPQSADLLLKAALELFACKNYSMVTIKDIATETGVNAALIYYYFGSKEGLFRAVIEATALEAYGTFEAIRDDAAAPEDIVALWVRNHVHQFPLMRKLIMISIDYANTHKRSGRIDQAIRKFYDIEAEVLGAALREGVATGRFKPVDVAQITIFISTFLDGALVRSVMLPYFDAERAIDDLLSFVLATLKGGSPAETLRV